jgi:hypothetical protein
VTTQPKAQVKVRRIYLPDEALRTTRVRGIGFRAHCSCGWVSKTARSYSEARTLGRAHQIWHAQSPASSLAGPL